MLAFVLVFLRKFDDLSVIPVAYTSMIIVIVAGGPGKTLGACVQGVALAFLGVGLGSGFFVILAVLADFPVAQALIFAVIVYCEFCILIFILPSAEPRNGRRSPHSTAPLDCDPLSTGDFPPPICR
jgi:hypothetical protein